MVKSIEKIVLTSVEEPLFLAWKKWCGHFDFVTVKKGSILDDSYDAIVSPSNSFGFMNGGIDAVYTQHFGSQLEERVRKVIKSEHYGELLVGQAILVVTGQNPDKALPYLVAAPTMRVPMKLPPDTVNPYLAAKAALQCVLRANEVLRQYHGDPRAQGIKTIAFPGLGTGIGSVDPEKCAWQMRVAIEEVLLEGGFDPAYLQSAFRRHYYIVEPGENSC